MYMVELNYISGWDDANWNEDGIPLRFDTIQQAQDEIYRLCAWMNYNKEDYRISRGGGMYTR